MKTFLISPVRGVSQELNEYAVYVLESAGFEVYYPARDTDQNDDTGYHICQDNKQAILDADMVHFIWDGKSQGCLFDLGMAFMANKPVVSLNMPERTDGKSFQNMVAEWERQQTK